MDFNAKKEELINTIENRPNYQKDPALKNSVELLKQIQTPFDLEKKKGLITHTLIDSGRDMEAGELILKFISSLPK